MKNIAITRDTGNDPITNLPYSKINTVSFHKEESELDDIVYALICAAQKQNSEYNFKRMEELSRLEYASKKLNSLINKIRKEQDEN
jgi:hypothetical protein